MDRDMAPEYGYKMQDFKKNYGTCMLKLYEEHNLSPTRFEELISVIAHAEDTLFAQKRLYEETSFSKYSI